jgi:hypothetical protein
MLTYAPAAGFEMGRAGVFVLEEREIKVRML